MRTQASSGDRVISARSFLPAALTGLALLAGCGSGSGGSGSGGDLSIQTCSLNCSVGSGGDQVFCIVRNVTENGEVSVTFSAPIDPTTLTPSTLQVTDVGNGTSPDGLRFLDPLDPRRVIFRPAITFVGGSVAFSLQQNRSYEIRIPGVQQGDAGPFIRSVSGSANQSRMLCTIETTEGVEDIVPGNPEVDVFVDVDVTVPGGPFTTERTQIGSSVQNAVENVAASSKVYFEFNELMNLPTVANVVTGESLTIFVELDTDGDISTSGADRIPIPGTFELEVDQFTLTTSATFTPFGEIPSAGQNQRLLVVRVTTLVKDIANNSVTSASGGGVLVAIPEVLNFSQLVLPDADGEGFTNTDLENDAQTGAAWGNGRLAVGLTGGSGRLGSIRIAAGESLVLDTDSQAFPATGIAQIDVLGNNTSLPGLPPVYPNSVTVTDGVFELSSLVIEPTGTLVLRGSNPARLLVRGRCDLQPGSVVDLSGESAPEHDSSTVGEQVSSATPPVGGPNGALGGLGADRADLGATNLIGAGAIANPGANRDGASGGGVGASAIAAGPGGVRFPVLLPLSSSANLGNTQDVGYNVVGDPRDPTFITCVSQQLGGSGGGGGYALPGADGTSQPVGPGVLAENPAGLALSPGNTPGGDNGALNLVTPPVITNANYDTRLLRWEEGDLRGGSAGGGGGNHVYGTKNNAGGAGNNPPATLCLGFFNILEAGDWIDHSGAGGGAGGGALEVLAGREALVSGFVDASGGFGGGALSTPATAGSFAMPGGGASGGALRLRAPVVNIAATAQININGGLGGFAPWSLTTTGTPIQARGGMGSPGLIRVEDSSPNGAPISYEDVRQRVLPFDPLPGNEFTALNYLSVQAGYLDSSTLGTQRPDTLSGGTSCWIRPEGNFLQLVFEPDSGTSVAEQGWTMDIELSNGDLRPFRGTSTAFPNEWEAVFGNELGTSPIVVRFQGGRSQSSSLMDPCDVDENDPFGEVLPGSLTPWVGHPAEIGLVTTPGGANYTPNMIRFCVLFDKTNEPGDDPGQTLIDETVVGITNVRIIANPD